MRDEVAGRCETLQGCHMWNRRSEYDIQVNFHTDELQIAHWRAWSTPQLHMFTQKALVPLYPGAGD